MIKSTIFRVQVESCVLNLRTTALLSPLSGDEKVEPHTVSCFCVCLDLYLISTVVSSFRLSALILEPR